MSPFDHGVFTISLDFELIWGTVDKAGTAFEQACIIERDQVIDRLLDLFARHDISATWCILGHLFLDRCRAVDGVKHPEITRPNHNWVSGDWFASDPASDEQHAPAFYGRSLIQRIRTAKPRQEIGSHSFSHVIFGDPGCSRATADSELRECVRLAKEEGIELRSFAYPRNVVGHLDGLREHGFVCYRGEEPHWYERRRLPRPVKRLAHLADVTMAATPPVVVPERNANGVWNVAGSMIYFPRHGVRKWVPMSVRVRRAIKGLDRAAAEKKIFHLWFHPTNLAFDPDAMFDGLEQIAMHASRLRERGSLQVMTMEEAATAAERGSRSPLLRSSDAVQNTADGNENL